MSKPRIKFQCTECFKEVEGWAYQVGFDPFNPREVCSICWAAPRVPPMKPIGDAFCIYG